MPGETNVSDIEDKSVSKINEWYQIFGHLNEKNLLAMAYKGKAIGSDIRENEKLLACETCIKGKQTREPFYKSNNIRRKKS